MDKNQKIIIVLLVIIIAILAVGLIIFANNGFASEDCKITINCNKTMADGDKITFKLTDMNKTAIANATIKVKLIKGDDIQEFNFTTTNKGNCALTLTGLEDGKYKIECSFDGNNHYKATNSTKKFTYSNEVTATTESSSVDPIDANRPTNDINYKGYTPYHESEVTSDGWNPREHEVSREKMPDGSVKIRYDDSYFRLVDENGYVITYGYG